MARTENHLAETHRPVDRSNQYAASAGRYAMSAGLLRNAWYLAAFGHEIAKGIVARTILNEPIVLFRSPNGVAAALEDRCPHVGAPLSLGKMTPGGLQCGYHGMVFDHLGKCVQIPGQEKIPSRACVRSYPVAERGGHIWMWMGDPALAQNTPLPDFEPDDAFFNWPHYQNVIPFKANYTLMIQNLMDLTHLGYLHPDSIGGDPADHARDQVDVERTPRGVIFVRTMRDVTAPGRYVDRFGTNDRLDRWSEFEYLAPAVMRANSAWGPVGTRVIESRGGAMRDKMLVSITPSTDDTSFYFVDLADGMEPDASRAIEQMSRLNKVIMEDVVMVEAQQKRLEGVDPRTLIAIRSDRPRLMMMEELDRRLRQEQTSTHPETPIDPS